MLSWSRYSCTPLVYHRHSFDSIGIDRCDCEWEMFWRAEKWSRQWVHRAANKLESFWRCCWHNYVTDMCSEKGQTHFIGHETDFACCRIAARRLEHVGIFSRELIKSLDDAIFLKFALDDSVCGEWLCHITTPIERVAFVRVTQWFSLFCASNEQTQSTQLALFAKGKTNVSKSISIAPRSQAGCAMGNWVDTGILSVHAHRCLASQW